MKVSILAALGCLSLASAQEEPAKLFFVNVNTGSLVDGTNHSFTGKLGECVGLEEAEYANSIRVSGEINSCVFYNAPKCANGDDDVSWVSNIANDKTHWSTSYNGAHVSHAYGNSGRFGSVRCYSIVALTGHTGSGSGDDDDE